MVVLIVKGCVSSDSGTDTDPPNGTPTGYVLISQVIPSVMPDTGSFTVKIFGQNVTDPVALKIRIKEYNQDSCLAVDTVRGFDFGGNDSISFRVSNFKTGCNNLNKVYQITVTDTVDNVGDQWVYVRGTPSLDPRLVSLELANMPYNTNGKRDTIKKGIDSTYNNPNSALDQVNVNIGYSNWTTPSVDHNFRAEAGDAAFIDSLAVYANSIKPVQGYTYFLILARNQYMYREEGFTVLGLSMNQAQNVSLGNWSYVFSAVIDSAFSSPSYNRNSVKTYITCHELLHQLGNAFGSGLNSGIPDNEDLYSDHLYHWGRNIGTCVLYHANRSNPLFNRSTGFYRICDRHIFKLRDNLGNPPPLAMNTMQNNMNNEYYSGGETGNKYKVKVSLAKEVYKKFEPILAQVTIINNSTNKLNLKKIFATSMNYAQFFITNKSGKISNTNKYPLSLNVLDDVPSYIINPGDTLYGSMPINNWGDAVSYKSTSDNEVYFEQMGYLEPGEYKLEGIFSLEKNSTKIICKSNAVNFQVIDNNEEDKTILNLYKQKKYQVIIDSYPENSLTEHAYAIKLLNKHIEILNDFNYSDKQDLESDYAAFIAKYSSSFYLINDWFLSPYMIKEFKGNTNLRSAIETVKSQINNEMINKFLKNETRIKRISERN